MNPESVISAFNGLATSLRDLPLGVHGSALATLVGGLVLWFAGAKVLKPVIAIAGAALGASIGSMLLPKLGVGTIAGFRPELIGLILGVVIGILGAMVAFRFAMALAGAAGLAIAGVLGTAIYLSHTPDGLPPPRDETEQFSPSNQEISDRLKDAATEFGKSVDQAVNAAKGEQSDPTVIESARDKTREALDMVWVRGKDYWDRTPPKSRLLLIAAALVAGLAGALVGQIMPTKAAVVLTAMAGSAMALFSGVYLARAFEAPFAAKLDLGPTIWLCIWGGMAFIGVVSQLRRPGAAAPKPKPQPEPESK